MTTTTSTDRIERQITIAASVERVWEIITNPQHVSTWFCNGSPVTIDLRPGGTMHLDHGPDKSFLTRIETIDPPHYFSYRWASGYPDVPADDSNSTLVEFILAPEGDGTRLTLSESGFDALAGTPGAQGNASYESHSGGWNGKLEELLAYCERD